MLMMYNMLIMYNMLVRSKKTGNKNGQEERKTDGKSLLQDGHLIYLFP